MNLPLGQPDVDNSWAEFPRPADCRSWHLQPIITDSTESYPSSSICIFRLPFGWSFVSPELNLICCYYVHHSAPIIYDTEDEPTVLVFTSTFCDFASQYVTPWHVSQSVREWWMTIRWWINKLHNNRSGSINTGWSHRNGGVSAFHGCSWSAPPWALKQPHISLPISSLVQKVAPLCIFSHSPIFDFACTAWILAQGHGSCLWPQIMGFVYVSPCHLASWTLPTRVQACGFAVVAISTGFLEGP